MPDNTQALKKETCPDCGLPLYPEKPMGHICWLCYWEHAIHTIEQVKEALHNAFARN